MLRIKVAPFAGAWIETQVRIGLRGPARVAPFAGAWIETTTRSPRTPARYRRPLRGGVD